MNFLFLAIDNKSYLQLSLITRHTLIIPLEITKMKDIENLLEYIDRKLQ